MGTYKEIVPASRPGTQDKSHSAGQETLVDDLPEVHFELELGAPDLPDNSPWKVLVVDDDESVHAMTRLVLGDLIFRERGLEFFSAYSAAEARDVMAEHPDMALVLLDVILERSHAGLDLVDYIRGALDNQAVQIILRTGQPGRIPEESVILNYDINGYKNKTELTYQRLLSVTIGALRTCERIRRLEDSRRDLIARNERLERELARAQAALV